MEGSWSRDRETISYIYKCCPNMKHKMRTLWHTSIDCGRAHGIVDLFLPLMTKHLNLNM